MIKDPLLVAALAALIGVLFQAGYEKWKHRSRRKAGMMVLKHQLENQRHLIEQLEKKIKKNLIFGGIDPAAVVGFINSDIVDLARDKQLLASLYLHLDNIRDINRASQNMNLHGIGGSDYNKQMHLHYEMVLRESVEIYLSDLQTCIDLL